MLLADTIEKPEEMRPDPGAGGIRACERAGLGQETQSISEYYSTRAAMARALVRLKETEKFVN